MIRESHAGRCWDVPVCTPSSAEQTDEGLAGTSQSTAARQNGAATQKAGGQGLTGAVLSSVLDELQAVQDLTVCSHYTEPFFPYFGACAGMHCC
jgi:hypothetical protein